MHDRYDNIKLSNLNLAICALYVIAALAACVVGYPSPQTAWVLVVGAAGIYGLYAWYGLPDQMRPRIQHLCNRFELMVSSELYNSDDGDSPSIMFFTASLLKWQLRVPMPPLFPVWRERHSAATWDVDTIARMGRDWYVVAFPRRFGVYLFEDHLCLQYGPQTHDSSTTKSRGMFLPWTQWWRVDHAILSVAGERAMDVGLHEWDWRDRVPAGCYQHFLFTDYDGQIITGRAVREVVTWRRGEKPLWRWLLAGCKPRISDSLDLHFDQEVGPEKGSWKGGMVGCSADFRPGDDYTSAIMRRFEGQCMPTITGLTMTTVQ